MDNTRSWDYSDRDFATIEDIELLWRPLTEAEKPKAVTLLSVVSASLRQAARMEGKDLDDMVVCGGEELRYVARSVTCDVVARALMTSTDQEPMTQMTESAGGYSASGTFLIPGGGLFIKKSELSRLGLRRQKVGVINFYD